MTEAVDAGTQPVSEAALSVDTPAVETVVTETADTTAEPKRTLDDDLRGVWEKNHPKRGEGGKFAPRSAETPATESAATETEAAVTESTDQPAEKAVEQPTAAIDTPLSWSSEMKARFAALPPEFRDLQQYAAQRDKEQQGVISRAGQEIKTFEPVKQLLEQNGDTFRKYNLSQTEGLSRVLGLANWMETDAPAAIKELCKAYNVDPKGLAPQPTTEAAATEQGAPDPRVSTLEQTLAATQTELKKVTSYLTAQQRSALESEQAALSRQIAEFAKERPHFDAVRKHMGALMGADESLTMEQAYEQATYAVPDIRQRILADQRKAEEDKRNKERAAQAAEAKKAGSINVKSATSAGKAPKSMDDTLREIAARRFA